MRFEMCACARTREYCVTRGCKCETFEWRFSTEDREKDRLRRVIDLQLKNRPASRWLKPEKAVTLAWLMNMKRGRPGTVFVGKLGDLDFKMDGVP